MRTPIYATFIAALLAAGCTTYVQPASAPGPKRPVDRVAVPEPEPEVQPLQLDIGRPTGGQLLLQTNRPAYVAIFEIIPDRSVSLIYPAAVHQQNMMISGLTWVPLWWSPRRVSFTSDRYIYAVASEEPLRLSTETFENDYLSRILGSRVYRAESPYATMRELSRRIVPNVADEAWAEDVYTVRRSFPDETYRVSRVYCPGSRVYEVPEEMASRIWCPTRTRVVIVDVSRPRTRDNPPVSRPVRPDSVFGQGGRRVKLEPVAPRGPIGRIVDPTGRGRDNPRTRNARDEQSDRDDERGNRDDRDERVWNPRRGKPEKADKDKERERESDDRDNNKNDKNKDKDNDRNNDRNTDQNNERNDDRDKDHDKDKNKDKQEQERGPRWMKPRREADEQSDDQRAKQQGEQRGENRDDKRADNRDQQQSDQRAEKRDDKQDKRDEKQEEKQDKKDDKQDKKDDKRSSKSIRDLIKDKNKKEQQDKQ